MWGMFDYVGVLGKVFIVVFVGIVLMVLGVVFSLLVWCVVVKLLLMLMLLIIVLLVYFIGSYGVVIDIVMVINVL